jgi:hypothetical protein
MGICRTQWLYQCFLSLGSVQLPSFLPSPLPSVVTSPSSPLSLPSSLIPRQRHLCRQSIQSVARQISKTKHKRRWLRWSETLLASSFLPLLFPTSADELFLSLSFSRSLQAQLLPKALIQTPLASTTSSVMSGNGSLVALLRRLLLSFSSLLSLLLSLLSTLLEQRTLRGGSFLDSKDGSFNHIVVVSTKQVNGGDSGANNIGQQPLFHSLL